MESIQASAVDRSGGALRILLCLCFILSTLLFAYSNSFDGVFVYDDDAWIVSNPAIRHPWQCMLNTTRPVIGFSLYLNYRIGGLDPWGYHLVNLAIHGLSAVLLFGILLSLPGRRNPYLCAVIASLWGVHPLQTESVTYVIQRSEAMMGMFYLLAVYSFLRGLNSVGRTAGRWLVLSVAACAIGMACKPVMVTAPAAILLLDGCISGGGAGAALRRRTGYYVMLGLTWLVPIALLAVPHESSGSAGFATGLVSAWQYARVQPAVILTYLKLCLYPAPLIIDRACPPVSAQSMIVSGIAVGAALAATMAGTIGGRKAYLPWAIFFLLLFPSSSFIPLTDFAAEHRVYLALAAVLVFAVSVVDAALDRVLGVLSGRFRPARQAVLVLIGVVAVVAAAFAARHRNEDYHSEAGLWAGVLRHRPDNVRAVLGLATANLRTGMIADAETLFGRAIALIGSESDSERRRLSTEYAMALMSMGVVRERQGRLADAEQLFRETLRICPTYTPARVNLAVLLWNAGARGASTKEWDRLCAGRSVSSGVYATLGSLQASSGMFASAVRNFEKALLLDPGLTDIRIWMGAILLNCPDTSVRDAGRAIGVLSKGTTGWGCTGEQKALLLSLLASAYAQSDDAGRALTCAGRAISLAEDAGRADLVKVIASDMAVYRTSLDGKRR